MLVFGGVSLFQFHNLETWDCEEQSNRPTCYWGLILGEGCFLSNKTTSCKGKKQLRIHKSVCGNLGHQRKKYRGYPCKTPCKTGSWIFRGKVIFLPRSYLWTFPYPGQIKMYPCDLPIVVVVVVVVVVWSWKSNSLEVKPKQQKQVMVIVCLPTFAIRIFHTLPNEGSPIIPLSFHALFQV